MSYFWCFRVEILQIVDEDFVLDITKNKLFVLVEEACNWMLVELYALDNWICFDVNLIENVSIHNGLNAMITTNP